MAANEHGQLYPQLAEAIAARHPAPLQYNPYGSLDIPATVVGMLCGEALADQAAENDAVELVLDATNFYVESGGQVSDTGCLIGPDWEMAVEAIRRPIEGVVVHIGRVVKGTPRVGDAVRAQVNSARRWDIMRNHTEIGRAHV